MPAGELESNVQLEDRLLKSRRLLFEVEITANATPADKGHSSDLPSVVTLRSEGKTSEADNVEDLSSSFNAPEDNFNGGDADGDDDCRFGLLVETGPSRVHKVEIEEETNLSSALSVSSIEGDQVIGLEVEGTDLDLASDSPRMRLSLDYVREISV